MRPLKARGKEWVHGLTASRSGHGLSASPSTATGISGISGPTYATDDNDDGHRGTANVEEDVDSDGSDLVRRVSISVAVCRSL